MNLRMAKKTIESMTLSDLSVGKKIEFYDGFIYEVQSFEFDKSSESYSVHVEPEKSYKINFYDLYYCVTNNSRCINITSDYVIFEIQDNVEWVDCMSIDEVAHSKEQLL